MQTDPAAHPAAVSATTPDAELAARAAAGDTRAFERVMRRYNQLLFRTARGILRSDVEAEDALQDAYLLAWRAIGSYRGEAKLSTWLVRIVIHQAFARLRRKSAEVIALDTAMEPVDSELREALEDDPGRGPEPRAQREEMRRLIESRIDLLPESFRVVFMLRAVEEMSVEEVAAALDVPEATVRTRFFRARGLLRESLSRDVDVAIGDAFSFAGDRCDRIVAGVLSRLAEDRDPSPS
jgi:RNA polymerase sigma-70 factor (ECF subfamily)